jgi:hypothetical protein
MKRRILLLLSTLILATVVCGCGNKEEGSDRQRIVSSRDGHKKDDDKDKKDNNKKTNKVMYTYVDPNNVESFQMDKATYYDNELVLSIKNLDARYNNVEVYDKDFHKLDGYTYKFGRDEIVIDGDNVRKISGINIINNGFNYISIRYLDSNQYQALVWYEATEVGTIIGEGDEDAYLTKAEKEARLERQKQYQAQVDDTYRRFAGKWVCESDPNEYIEIYEDENGVRRINTTFYYEPNGEYETSEDTFRNSTYAEKNYKGPDDNAYYILTYGDDGWGCLYSYEVSEDMNSMWVSYIDDKVYVRQ